MALDLKDFETAKGIVQTERTTVVNELRYGFNELGKENRGLNLRTEGLGPRQRQCDRDRIIAEVRAERAS